MLYKINVSLKYPNILYAYKELRSNWRAAEMAQDQQIGCLLGVFKNTPFSSRNHPIANRDFQR